MIEFRDSDHTYWLDGAEVPSVTRIIRSAGFGEDYDVNPQVRVYADRAAARSRAVHAAIEHWEACGILPEVDAASAGFLRSYVAWRETGGGEGLTVTGTEVRLHSAYGGGYAGTLDLCGRMNGRQIVIDLKARAKGPSRIDWWQVAAYAAAKWQDYDGSSDRMVLQLLTDGKVAKEHWDKDPAESWRSFETCLRWWHLRKAYGRPM